MRSNFEALKTEDIIIVSFGKLKAHKNVLPLKLRFSFILEYPTGPGFPFVALLCTEQAALEYRPRGTRAGRDSKSQ